MNRVVHFEIHAPDAAAARKFYEDVFGWQFTKWEGGDTEYWLVNTGEGDGIGGGMMPSQDGQPRTVNVVEVESVDDYADRIASTGGQIVVPKMAIPTVGWVAYATDPGGNIFGIFKGDPTAK